VSAVFDLYGPADSSVEREALERVLETMNDLCWRRRKHVNEPRHFETEECVLHGWLKAKAEDTCSG